jgi:hypothetical protein
MSVKFDTLIEHVVNGNEKKARAIFHQLVVEKSRKIYEDMDLENPSEVFDDVEADHVNAPEEFGGDQVDDFTDEIGVEGEDEDDELNPELDDRVTDLEDELSNLQAEFEQLLASEEGEHEEESDDFEDLADTDEDEAESDENIESEVETDDFDSDDEDEFPDEDEDEDLPVSESLIREYVERITKNLASSSEESFVQKKSPVASKPSIVPGITAKNIAQGGVEKGRPAPTPKELIGDKEVVNRPGHKAALKPAPKATNKEVASVNKKSVEDGKK